MTLSVIRDQLADIVSARFADDPHLHYLDGQNLDGPRDVIEHPSPDILHPDAATHQVIGERFVSFALPAGGPRCVQ